MPESRIIRGRYRLLARVGGSGLSCVYKAEDLRYNRSVAIKVTQCTILDLYKPSERLVIARAIEEEPLHLARISHSCIIRPYEDFVEAGAWYLVMEWVEGVTIQKYQTLYRGGERRSLQVIPELFSTGLSVEQVLSIGIQLFDLLSYLHHLQPAIVHRDVKPSNLMLSPDGRVILIDFGIAHTVAPDGESDHLICGTWGYCPPEQHLGLTTPLSDLYSTGVTLYCLLTGIDAPRNASLERFVPIAISPLILPSLLRDLLQQMTATNPQQRPSSAHEASLLFASLWEEITGTAATRERLQVALEMPRVSYSSSGKRYTVFLGQTMPYLFRVKRASKAAIVVSATIVAVGNKPIDPFVQVQFIHPHTQEREKRWLNTLTFWRLFPEK